MNYHTLGVTLTRKCNAECDICCSECGPSSAETVDVKVIKSYIASSKDVKKVKCIGFTGGEVFLEYELLKELMETAKEAGKESTIVTNAFWAWDLEQARKRIAELKMLGLKKIGISFDRFHQKYIPADHVSHLLKAAYELSIDTEINMVITAGENYSTLLLQLGNSIGGSRINFIPCYPVGRALKSLHSSQYIKMFPSSNRYCMKSGIFNIDVNGEITPCCNPAVFNTELSIGNMKDLTVSETYEKLRNHPILYMLRNKGFDYFIDIAKHKLNIPVPEYIITSCELCSLFFNSRNIHKFTLFAYKDLLDNKPSKTPNRLLV